MKEDELLAYKAPIKYHRGHQGYYYTDDGFSITEVPLGEEDLAHGHSRIRCRTHTGINNHRDV